MLVTRPRHDAAVEYLYHWAEDVIRFAKGKGIGVIDCFGEKANRAEVSSHLAKQSPRLVLFNGHGNPDAIHGHGNEVLVDGGTSGMLKSKIVYAVSCMVASALGKNSCEKGCSAFIGYEQDFGFIKDAQRECTSAKDRFARPFREASNAVPIALIKGSTAGEAFEKSQRKYEELIREYATSDSAPENKDIRFWLFWDRKFQRIHGDKAAVF